MVLLRKKMVLFQGIFDIMLERDGTRDDNSVCDRNGVICLVFCSVCYLVSWLVG